MPPFGESILVLGAMFLFLGCTIVMCIAIYRLHRYGKVTLRFGIVASIAVSILGYMVLPDLLWGEVEYNPRIDSSEQIAGTYSRFGRSITLNTDGTYTAKGFADTTSGKWRNEDYTIFLTNSPLQPRIVTRGKKMFLLPFYVGPDEGPSGPFFSKTIE